ncbi:hypothetical protein LCGC14_0994230 [marine sediment metagenome]|uniref:Uncharacterized protein n=1 Tax=marine sediment metagenome TaxID=412755 RepID=A0A0F9NRA7_9ZZZZ
MGLPNLPAVYRGTVFIKGDMGKIAIPAIGGTVFAIIPNVSYIGEPKNVSLTGSFETLVVAPPVYTEQPTHFFYVPEGSVNAFEMQDTIAHRVGNVIDLTLVFIIDESIEESEPELDLIDESVVNLVDLILERQLKLGKEIGDLDELSQCLIRFKAP